MRSSPGENSFRLLLYDWMISHTSSVPQLTTLCPWQLLLWNPVVFVNLFVATLMSGQGATETHDHLYLTARRRVHGGTQTVDSLDSVLTDDLTTKTCLLVEFKPFQW